MPPEEVVLTVGVPYTGPSVDTVTGMPADPVATGAPGVPATGVDAPAGGSGAAAQAVLLLESVQVAPAGGVAVGVTSEEIPTLVITGPVLVLVGVPSMPLLEIT